MRKWTRNPKIVAAAVIVTAGLAWLAFGFFAVHLLFVDDRVDEAAPVFADGGPTTSPASSLPAVDTRPRATTSPPSSPPPTQPAVVTEFEGTFVSRAHETSGTAIVVGNGTDQRFLRFESFATENGPDLNVYLVNSSAGGVVDFIDLGDLKGNIGDQNYELPPVVDLGVHDTVLIWCVRFSSPFGEASLTPADR